MTDFEYGRWYRDSAKEEMWRMESRIEAVGDYLIFAVSSFESWKGKNIPKNIAVINNDHPNIGVIRLQDGDVTIDADNPIPNEVMADVLINVVAYDIKKSIDRHMGESE